MKHPKKLVKDMIGHDLSIDDTHKATEGGECNSCGTCGKRMKPEYFKEYTNVCNKCYNKR